jgi:uncharacterized protein DUF6011
MNRDTQYKWVWVNDSHDRLFDVGILADGSLYNPRGYPPEIVRNAVLKAIERQHEWQSQAAKKAAVTRARCRGKKIYAVIKKLQLGHKYGPANHCVICGKELGDPESITRGIGSDCWQLVIRGLNLVTTENSSQIPPIKR